MPKINCFQCKKVFYKRPNVIKEKNFCSSKCYSVYRLSLPRNVVELLCHFCHKSFYKRPANIRGKNTYCSMKCVYAYHKGKKIPKEIVAKRKLKTDKDHHAWKGKDVGYAALHTWIKRRFKKPDKCQDCKEKEPLDLANISQKYKRDLSDWEWLCRKCHMLKDGRIKNLKQYQNT